MLGDMTPGEFDEQYAAWAIDGFDDSWEQIGEMTSAIVNQIKLASAGWGAKVTADDMTEPSDFMPQRYFPKAHEKKPRKRKRKMAPRMTSEQMEAAARSSVGV